MSLLWKIIRDIFQEKLENPDSQIQATNDALHLLKEISEEKGEAFLKQWLSPELSPELLFEYIKYYEHHIPFGLTFPDGSARPEGLLAQELLIQLCALIPHSKEAARSFCITMGHLFLLPHFSD
jgi:hypothetical protein